MSSSLNVTEQGCHRGDTDSQISVPPCFIFSLESIFRFLFSAYEGKLKCQIIAKNFFGRNCLGREIPKEAGKLPGNQEELFSGNMKE